MYQKTESMCKYLRLIGRRRVIIDIFNEHDVVLPSIGVSMHTIYQVFRDHLSTRVFFHKGRWRLATTPEASKFPHPDAKWLTSWRPKCYEGGLRGKHTILHPSYLLSSQCFSPCRNPHAELLFLTMLGTHLDFNWLPNGK